MPKSFQGPKAGPKPHAEKGSLRSHDAAVHHQQFRPVMIWAPRSNPGSAPEVTMSMSHMFCYIPRVWFSLKERLL